MSSLLVLAVFAAAVAGSAVAHFGLAVEAAQSVPKNASARPGGGWACDDGFIKRGNQCVSVRQATDDEIRDHLMTRSLEGYSGNCPCPHNVDRAGRRCGARSAYNRPGGASPLCYRSDVTKGTVDDYRKRYVKS